MHVEASDVGMDVVGKNKDHPVGGYFRRNVWGWRRLADCVQLLAPVESAPCTHWQSNDGKGLNAAQSVALADKLDALIASGSVQKYIEVDDATIKQAVAQGDKYADWYSLELNDVREFSAFLRDSGGFKIW